MSVEFHTKSSCVSTWGPRVFSCLLRCICFSKLPLDLSECVCLVPCDRLVSNPECIPISRPVFQGFKCVVTLTSYCREINTEPSGKTWAKKRNMFWKLTLSRWKCILHLNIGIQLSCMVTSALTSLCLLHCVLHKGHESGALSLCSCVLQWREASV